MDGGNTFCKPQAEQAYCPPKHETLLCCHGRSGMWRMTTNTNTKLSKVSNARHARKQGRVRSKLSRSDKVQNRPAKFPTIATGVKSCCKKSGKKAVQTQELEIRHSRHSSQKENPSNHETNQKIKEVTCKHDLHTHRLLLSVTTLLPRGPLHI